MFLVPGAFTATGTGGANVGPFTVNVTLPASPTLVSPVNNGVATRSSGLTVTWTGGAGNVLMEVYGPTDSTFTNGAVAVCSAPASAGSFAIPSYVMMALPATGANSTAGLVVSTVAPEVPFTATGLTVGGEVDTYINFAGFGYGWGSGGFTLK